MSREDDSLSESDEDENNTAKHQREKSKEMSGENVLEPDYDNEDLIFDLEGKIDYNDNLSKTSTQVTTNDQLKFMSTYGSNSL